MQSDLDESDLESRVVRLGGEVRRNPHNTGNPIEAIIFWNCPIQDNDLAFLQNATSIRALSLRFTHVSDGLFEHLADWRDLENLDCGQTRVKGHGLRLLSPLCPLKLLSIAGPCFDPEHLSIVAQRTEITLLDLWESRISDVDVESLLPMTQLESLLLTKTAITDAAMRTIARITSLRELGLSDTAITNAGISDLTPLERLENLDISFCGAVSEAGLSSLISLPRISEIVAYGSRITREIANRVRKKCPAEVKQRLKIITY